jgi:hypothetical protein
VAFLAIRLSFSSWDWSSGGLASGPSTGATIIPTLDNLCTVSFPLHHENQRSCSGTWLLDLDAAELAPKGEVPRNQAPALLGDSQELSQADEPKPPEVLPGDSQHAVEGSGEMKYLITVKRIPQEPEEPIPETIYEQSVEMLDLKALIDAVNLQPPKRRLRSDKGKPRKAPVI